MTTVTATTLPGHHVIITRDGKISVVMMSADEFDGLMETLDIMSDPVLSDNLQKNLSSKRKEKLISWGDI